MELKKGSQTGKPSSVEASLHVDGVLQPFSGSSGYKSESVHEDPGQIENSSVSNDASSLSSYSASNKCTQLHPKVFPAHHNFTPVEKPGREKENDVSTEALSKLEECYRSSTSSTSPRSDITYESVISNVLPARHPPIQVMERTAGFDPNRIPASVFAKPTTAKDWSLASTESLFSIQTGIGSFSEDQSIVLDLDSSEEFRIHDGSYFVKELNQSGGMIKPDKLHQCKQVKESGELEILRENIAKEKEDKSQDFGLCNTEISGEPIANMHYRSINDDFMIKTEGFGNGKANHTHSKQKKSPSSPCACCPSCHCSCTLSCCCCQKPYCSCNCLSCPPWPCCSCKKLCCGDCCLKWPSLSSCCCCCCNCQSGCYPTWSLKDILCCMSSKGSAA